MHMNIESTRENRELQSKESHKSQGAHDYKVGRHQNFGKLNESLFLDESSYRT
jgi:hypothetical protein